MTESPETKKPTPGKYRLKENPLIVWIRMPDRVEYLLVTAVKSELTFPERSPLLLARAWSSIVEC